MSVGKKKSFWSFLTDGSGTAVTVAALLFVIASLLLFLFASWSESWAPKVVSDAIRQTAHLLLTVGGIQFLLRTKIWKDAIDFVGEKLQLKEATIDSGLTRYWKFDAVPWIQLFEESNDISIVAISARPILVDRLATVRDFLSRDGTRLRLILADFRDRPLMGRFDAEFREAPGTRANKLKEALCELLKALDMPAQAKVDVHLYTSRVPYSAYRFDEKYLFVPYIAQPVRDSRKIPALLFAGGGMVNNYLEPEFEFLVSSKAVGHDVLRQLLGLAPLAKDTPD